MFAFNYVCLFVFFPLTHCNDQVHMVGLNFVSGTVEPFSDMGIQNRNGFISQKQMSFRRPVGAVYADVLLGFLECDKRVTVKVPYLQLAQNYPILSNEFEYYSR